MKSNQTALLLGLLVAIGFGSSVLAADLWTTKDGMTVYTFDNDPSGKSVCNGPCAQLWPAVAPEAMKGSVDTITRDDGSKQAAVKGKPLYRYSADTKPGDMNGEGFKGVWHVLPAGGKTSSGSTYSPPAVTY
jgi:predicted lipoprotein with Yx(FWY)xxD motif